jgi:hypothetical protein
MVLVLVGSRPLFFVVLLCLLSRNQGSRGKVARMIKIICVVKRPTYIHTYPSRVWVWYDIMSGVWAGYEWPRCERTQYPTSAPRRKFNPSPHNHDTTSTIVMVSASTPPWWQSTSNTVHELRGRLWCINRNPAMGSYMSPLWPQASVFKLANPSNPAWHPKP